MLLLNPLAFSPRYRDGLPVLPGAFPLVGHMPALYRGAPAVVLRGREELGPMFWMTNAFGTWTLHCMGQEALEILKSKSFTSAHMRRLSPYVIGDSMFAQDGEAHRRVRGVMNSAFHPRGLSASAVGAMTARTFSGLAARWVDQKKTQVLADTREVALEIVFRMIGIPQQDLPAWSKQYRELLLANYGINLMFPGSPMDRASRACAWLNARFLAIIEAQRRSPEPGSLLSALAHAKDEAGEPLTDMELVDNLRLVVLGGHETVASMMAWMIVMLASRPELWDALCDEARTGHGVPTTPQEARAFPFAEALFRETLRMYPPLFAVSRMATEDVWLYGRRIPAGTQVSVDLWSIAHDPALFAEPEAFQPSRWLDRGLVRSAACPHAAVEGARSIAPTAIEVSQFGGGPHFCPGYHLAWLEAVQVAVALAREMAPRGLRPRLRAGRLPRPIYLPTTHPPAKTVVEFASVAV